MSISTPPPPAPPKKSGLGCFGCGCIIVIVLLLLFGALAGGAVYMAYKAAYTLTAETPATIPAVAPDDQAYQATKQKIGGFAHDVSNHQAATINLSGDELNALIANNPDVVSKNIHSYITLTNDEGRVQLSMPVSAIAPGVLPGRYIDLDATFKLHFDPDTKSIMADFETLRFENHTLIGEPNADEQGEFSASFVRGFSQSFGPAFNQSFNQALRKNPAAASFLDQIKSVEIKDGQLVIETQ
jgi:hypothetical protein